MEERSKDVSDDDRVSRWVVLLGTILREWHVHMQNLLQLYHESLAADIHVEVVEAVVLVAS